MLPVASLSTMQSKMGTDQQIQFHVYTPGIYAYGIFSFRLSVRMFVSSFVSSLQFASKFLVKVSLVVSISYTNGQKPFMFGPLGTL